MFYPNCTQNHPITYTNVCSQKSRCFLFSRKSRCFRDEVYGKIEIRGENRKVFSYIATKEKSTINIHTTIAFHDKNSSVNEFKIKEPT